MLGLITLSRSVLVLALVVALLASAAQNRASGAAAESSLTLYTVECSEPLEADGTPITVDACDTTVDRTFTLRGPTGQEAKLAARLEFGLNAPRARVARWSVNSSDDLEDVGTYTLTESSESPDGQTLFECLLTTDDGLVPADLIYVDGGVQFEWTPVDAASEDADRQTLVCHAYSSPADESDSPMAGVIQVHASTATPAGETDLIVRAADDDPYDLGDDDAGSVPSLSYTLADAAGREITLTVPESDEGSAVSSFPVPTGSYTLTSAISDTSVEVRVESGQTVLVFNPLGEPSGEQDEASLDLEVVKFTPTPAVVETLQVDETPQVVETETFAFSAADWAGAYSDIVAEVYKRDCVAIYGAGSPNPAGSLSFVLDRVTTGNSQLILTGLDDEVAGSNPMVVTVNGQVVYDAGSPFFDWDPNDPEVAWSQFVLTVPNDVLVAGANEIVVANASPGGSIGGPPYILLAEASVVVSLSVDAD